MRRVRFTDPPPLAPDEPAYSSPTLEAWYSEKRAISMQRMAEFDAKPRLLRDMLNVIPFEASVQGLLAAGYRDADSAEAAYRARCEQIRIQQEQEQEIEMQVMRRTRRG